MTKKMTRTRAEAKKLMWEYYQENKTLLPKNISVHRESLIADIGLGMTVESAFDRAVQTVSNL
jgi:hypothetical protein